VKSRHDRANSPLFSSIVSYVLALIILAGLCLGFVSIVTNVYVNDATISPWLGILNVVQVLVFSMLFLPLRRLLDYLLRKILYVHNYDSAQFFAHLNRTLMATTDLRWLLKRASAELAETLQARQVFFFIYHTQQHYISAGTPHHKELARKDAHEVGEWFATHSADMLLAATLARDDPMRRLMISHQIEIIVPLERTDQTIGYLCLGETIHGMKYTKRDQAVIDAISDELMIAIQNALSVQEVKELNETLQQRIASATKELRASNAQLQKLDEAKDEFISMASHQLRTPLTSVKGYISMVVEGDAGKITDNQRHLLSEAFVSSERMVRLINDFLNVSRLQTGKFMIEKRNIDLAKIVRQEIESLEPSASARGLKFSFTPPKNFPLLSLDESKIRQVIMNFSDNAIYYSKENSTIKISLKADKKEVQFMVKDTGIGVPKSEQGNLFNKFFRATNARKQRPDGTGVGLFLAKKVIDAHNGGLIFESIEGKGSTFGFKLSLAKSKAVAELKENTEKLDK
jgi:signal transduction histidine kinase